MKVVAKNLPYWKYFIHDIEKRGSSSKKINLSRINFKQNYPNFYINCSLIPASLKSKVNAQQSDPEI